MFRLLIVYPMKPTNQVRVSLLCTESTQAWSHSPCESAASGFFWSDHCHQSRGWGLCATQRLCPGTTGHTAEERTVADVSCELENQMVAWLIFWSSANLLSAPLPLAVLWRTPYLLDCSNRIHINICVWACLGFDLWWGSNHVCSCYAEADGAGYWERKCYTTLALPLTFRHRCSKFQRWMLMVTIPCFFFLTMHFQFTVAYGKRFQSDCNRPSPHSFQKVISTVGSVVTKNLLPYNTTALWIFLMSKAKKSALIKSNLDTDC